MRDRLLSAGGFQQFSKGVAGAGQEFVRVRGIERGGELCADSFVQTAFRQDHCRMSTGDRHARPRDVHGGRIGDGDHA